MSSTNAVRNVIFDVGGVLVEWNPKKILGNFYADESLRALLQNSMFTHPEWRALDRGDLSEVDLIANVSDRTGRPTAEIAALLDAMRASLLPKPATVALLRALHRMGVPLYCLSNMPLSVYAFLRVRHDFWNLFRGIVISGEVKMVKPEPEIFDFLLARFALLPEETVFVDDMEINVEAAAGAGMHTIRFTDAADAERRLLPLLGLGGTAGGSGLVA